jgi:hypothetical protein
MFFMIQGVLHKEYPIKPRKNDKTPSYGGTKCKTMVATLGYFFLGSYTV